MENEAAKCATGARFSTAADHVSKPGSPDAAIAPAAPTAPAAAAGDAAPERNPHILLDELHGGPTGSPTAQLSNPQPGTSTSIPTTHPATVRPLPARDGTSAGVSVEDTGIDGQCDPNVSFGCPTITRPAAATPPGDSAAPPAPPKAAGQPANGSMGGN